DRHPLTPEVVVVIPARGMERVPLERVLEPRRRRLMQLTGGHYHGVRLPAATVRALDRPRGRLIVPGARDDVSVGNHRAVDAVVAGNALEVAEDLRLRRAQARPVGALRVAERIEVRGHVARAPGIGVVEPGPADARPPLQDRHVVEAVASELDGGSDPTEAGP